MPPGLAKVLFVYVVETACKWFFCKGKYPHRWVGWGAFTDPAMGGGAKSDKKIEPPQDAEVAEVKQGRSRARKPKLCGLINPDKLRDRNGQVA